MSTMTVGFVGLGAMGSRTAGRLLDAATSSTEPTAVAGQMLARASELDYAHRDLAALHEVLAESPAA